MQFAYTIVYVADVAASLAFFERAFGLKARFLHESGSYGELDTGAAGTALAPLFFGVDALTSTWFTIPLGPLGSVDFVTSTIFDIGVYLVVIGLVLDVLRSLGAEVDRQTLASAANSRSADTRGVNA